MTEDNDTHPTPQPQTEIHLPKPSSYKWLHGKRGTWWYKVTKYGVRTGCPCCGHISLRHADNCPRCPRGES